MMLFTERLVLNKMFCEWAEKERFGAKTPECFLIFLLSNGMINEEKAKEFIKEEMSNYVKSRP